jgi:hypothetical protein
MTATTKITNMTRRHEKHEMNILEDEEDRWPMSSR